MQKQCWIGLLMLIFIAGSSASLVAGETIVGGHVKMKLFDRPSGEHNDTTSSRYSGMGVGALYLYFYKQLSNKVAVEIRPEWAARTGATPKFGKDIGDQAVPAGDVEPGFHGFVKFLVKMMLPRQFEVSFGIVKPQWTWDYGAELFWEDQIIGGKFSSNDYLGSMHETGFEFYKSFEMGSVTVPAYLYLLNGTSNEFSDNNNKLAYMITAEPECGPFKLKAGYSLGQYDDDASRTFVRYMGGASVDVGRFSSRAEFSRGNWEKNINNTEDAEPWGFYAKAFYRYASWMRISLFYDYVKNNYIAARTGPVPGSQKYITMTPALQLYLTSSTILQVQYDMADWKQNYLDSDLGPKDVLKFNRFSVGLRSTF